MLFGGAEKTKARLRDFNILKCETEVIYEKG